MSKQDLDTARIKLTESAFDFLEKSVGEIKKHPKYAVIHFATAVELLLKARLMGEHWTLLADRTSDVSLEDFLAGRSKTVSQADAIKRLNNACGENIPKDAIAQFAKIAVHRNRMIHFFHEAGTEQADQDLVEEIVKEQCLCWLHLERLLTEWKDQFEDFERSIQSVSWRMRRNRKYLSVSFERLKPKISQDKKSGLIFRACSGCGYEASAVKRRSDMLFETQCRVCNLAEAYVNISCPGECATTLQIEANSASDRECSECEYLITADELAGILNTEGYDPTDFNTPMNCACCTTPDSVVKHHEIYVCSECLATSNNIAGCEWCNELQMGGGDLEWSYQSGCEFCDGQVAWRKDD